MPVTIGGTSYIPPLPAAVIFANHYMINSGQGLLVIPQEHVPEFKCLLVAYYEDRDDSEITEFMRTLCWRTF